MGKATKTHGVVAAMCVATMALAAGAAEVRVEAPRPKHDWDMVYRTFTNATEQIQGAIDEVFRAGGGRVVVGKGHYPIKGLRLRSGVTLYLERGAALQASRDSADFNILEHDAVEPVSGVAEAAKDAWERPQGVKKRSFVGNALSPWNNAIIRILNAHDVAIIGEEGSVIDGSNGYNPNGEEQYRGVHGVSAFDSTNIVYRGFTIRHTGNWALRHQRCADIVCEKVTMLAGHDGFHVRACTRVRVSDCFIHTGDDSIAGFANRDMEVRRCDISSACSAFRLGGRDINARSWVSRFNFSGADQEKLCGVLSGGERNRLHLALTLKDEGNVLLLDEPTNDVDVNTIRALEDGLDGFAGCAVVVSHDRWFLDRIATHILAFEGDGQVYFFEGSYSEYEENRKARLGDTEPKRFKYKKLME